MSHALVLLIAATITGYSAGNLDVSLRAHDGPFAAHAAGGDEVYGGLDLNRDTVIIKPLSIPTQALPDRKPIAYRVRAGGAQPGFTGWTQGRAIPSRSPSLIRSAPAAAPAYRFVGAPLKPNTS